MRTRSDHRRGTSQKRTLRLPSARGLTRYHCSSFAAWPASAPEPFRARGGIPLHHRREFRFGLPTPRLSERQGKHQLPKAPRERGPPCPQRRQDVCSAPCQRDSCCAEPLARWFKSRNCPPLSAVSGRLNRRKDPPLNSGANLFLSEMVSVLLMACKSLIGRRSAWCLGLR